MEDYNEPDLGADDGEGSIAPWDILAMIERISKTANHGAAALGHPNDTQA
jgi:hypothetical protein